MDVLADVNVIFSLVNERHVHHKRVSGWFDSQGSGFRLCICRLVQMAFIRLLSNKAAMDGDPLSLAAAWKVYADLIKDPSIMFIHEPKGFQPTWIGLCSPYGASPKVLSDAYLAAISITTSLPLVSLDKDFGKFPELSLIIVE